MRYTMGICALMAIAVYGCDDDRSADPASLRSIEDVAEALGCDALRRTDYEVGAIFDFPDPYNPPEDEEGKDCYRSGQFIGRIHYFGELDAAEVMSGVNFFPAVDRQPPCQHEQVELVLGPNWAVVTRGQESGDDVAERTGGRRLGLPAESETLASYPLPCVGDPEPP